MSKEKLVVTNYDNFKNAEFFKKQYIQAKAMMDEVNDFYRSFCMSKLLTAQDLKNINPYLIENHVWSSYFIFPDFDNHTYLSNKLRDKDVSWIRKPTKSLAALKLFAKEYTANAIDDFCKIIEHSPEYDCYFVLDKYNILHEFIPVKCKDTITIDFLGDDIIISGYYFDYSEHGGRFGSAVSQIDKRTVSIIINGSNNNVEKVETSCKEVETGNANGKSYWDKHISYAMTSRDENCISTRKWYDIRNKIKVRYDRHKELYRHSCIGDGMTNEQFFTSLMKEFKDEYKEYFGKPITYDFVERCCTVWW